MPGTVQETLRVFTCSSILVKALWDVYCLHRFTARRVRLSTIDSHHLSSACHTDAHPSFGPGLWPRPFFVAMPRNHPPSLTLCGWILSKRGSVKSLPESCQFKTASQGFSHFWETLREFISPGSVHHLSFRTFPTRRRLGPLNANHIQ